MMPVDHRDSQRVSSKDGKRNSFPTRRLPLLAFRAIFSIAATTLAYLRRRIETHDVGETFLAAGVSLPSTTKALMAKDRPMNVGHCSASATATLPMSRTPTLDMRGERRGCFLRRFRQGEVDRF